MTSLHGQGNMSFARLDVSLTCHSCCVVLLLGDKREAFERQNVLPSCSRNDASLVLKRIRKERRGKAIVSRLGKSRAKRLGASSLAMVSFDASLLNEARGSVDRIDMER